MFIRTENAVKSFDTEFTCTMLCCCVVWGQNGAGRVCHFARQVRLGAPCSLARFFFNLQVLIHPTGGSKYCKPWDFGPFFFDVARTQATRGHPNHVRRQRLGRVRADRGGKTVFCPAAISCGILCSVERERIRDLCHTIHPGGVGGVSPHTAFGPPTSCATCAPNE